MEFWTPLPVIFKKSVINDLDYKARCRLRKCSKLDKFLVYSCPIYLDQVDIQPRRNDRMCLNIGKTYYDLHVATPRSDNMSTNKNYALEDAIRDFHLIFQNPRSKVKKLMIRHNNFQEKPEALQDLIFLLFDVSSQLKIEELVIQNYGLLVGTTLLKVLKALDSKTLKSLTLRKFPQGNEDIHNQILETEQWKSLKMIEITEKCNIQIDRFLHSNSFYVCYETFSGYEAWQCIEKYRSSPHPLRSIFYVFTNQDLSLSDIFGYFNVPVINQRLEADFLNDFFQHTQHFELSWSTDFVFVVKIAKRSIRGVVCRKEYLFDDFDEAEDL